MEARNLGVKIKTNQKVQRVFKEQDIWKVQVEGWIYEGEAVILANGSKASAISGSDGSGYELAAALGHRLIEPLPALTALKCRNTGFSGWDRKFLLMIVNYAAEPYRSLTERVRKLVASVRVKSPRAFYVYTREFSAHIRIHRTFFQTSV